MTHTYPCQVYADPNGYIKFLIGLLFTELAGITMIVTTCVWLSLFRGGFGLDVSQVFNYHPLFMTIGMIFLYGNGNFLNLA